MFALAGHWEKELFCLAWELYTVVERHDPEAQPDLKKLLRKANDRMAECRASGESVAEAVVDALEQAIPLRIRDAERPDLLRFRGVFRFLPCILNEEFDALKEGSFLTRLQDGLMDFVWHEAEARLELKAAARRKKLAEEEEARHKKPAAEEKKLAAEEKKLAEEEEARRKRLAEEEEAFDS